MLRVILQGVMNPSFRPAARGGWVGRPLPECLVHALCGKGRGKLPSVIFSLPNSLTLHSTDSAASEMLSILLLLWISPLNSNTGGRSRKYPVNITMFRCGLDAFIVLKKFDYDMSELATIRLYNTWELKWWSKHAGKKKNNYYYFKEEEKRKGRESKRKGGEKRSPALELAQIICVALLTPRPPITIRRQI